MYFNHQPYINPVFSMVFLPISLRNSVITQTCPSPRETCLSRLKTTCHSDNQWFYTYIFLHLTWIYTYIYIYMDTVPSSESVVSTHKANRRYGHWHRAWNQQTTWMSAKYQVLRLRTLPVKDKNRVPHDPYDGYSDWSSVSPCLTMF